MVQRSLVGKDFLIIEALLSHYLRNTTIGRTSLGEWSAVPKDLSTENTRKRQTSILPGGIRTLCSVERKATNHALDRAATDRQQSVRCFVIVWVRKTN